MTESDIVTIKIKQGEVKEMGVVVVQPRIHNFLSNQGTALLRRVVYKFLYLPNYIHSNYTSQLPSFLKLPISNQFLKIKHSYLSLYSKN